jgi:hypothetical protein
LGLLIVEILHYFELPLDEIRGLSQVGRVPRSNKIVKEHAAWKHRTFLRRAMLVGKKL